MVKVHSANRNRIETQTEHIQKMEEYALYGDKRYVMQYVVSDFVGESEDFHFLCSPTPSPLPHIHTQTPTPLGWSGGAMVLGQLPVPGRPTFWRIVGQGLIALTVGGCLDIFTLLYLFSPLSPSLWETARYRLKYCLKGPLNPK